MFTAHYTLINSLTGNVILCSLPKTDIQDFSEYLRFVSENLPTISLTHPEIRISGLDIKEIIIATNSPDSEPTPIIGDNSEIIGVSIQGNKTFFGDWRNH